MAKRLFDIVASLLGLAVMTPLLLLAAVAVKVSSRGPVLFRQVRVGRDGREFRLLKFRTMVADAPRLGGQLTVEGDPRITPVGRVLRASKFDEFPQLWNVVVGDMSLVGPRPPTLDEIPAYAPWQARRLELTGGITGIWQTSGRHQVGFTDWMRMDVRYSTHRSLGMDVKLLAKTIWAVVGGRGAS